MASPATLLAVSRFLGFLSSEVEMKGTCRGQVTAEHACLLPRPERRASRTQAGSLWPLLTTVRRLGPQGRALSREGRVRAPSLIRGEPAPFFLLPGSSSSGILLMGQRARGGQLRSPLPAHQGTGQLEPGRGPALGERRGRKDRGHLWVSCLLQPLPPNQTGLGPHFTSGGDHHVPGPCSLTVLCVFSPVTFWRWAFSLAPPHS